MPFGLSFLWILIGTILGLSILGLIFSYLQVHYGLFIRNPFAPPKRGIFGRLKSRTSPFTKVYLAYRWFYIRYIIPVIRSLFIRPELSLTIFALAPAVALMAYWIQNGISIEPLILATLFYASVLFFKEFFLAEYPLVDLNPTLSYNDAKLTVTYEASNIGSKPISNLLLSHTVYDGDGRWLRGSPSPLGYRRESPISLEPGETSKEFRVPLEKSIGFVSKFDEWNIIEENTSTPIYVEIYAVPSIGHRFLGDRDMLRFDPYPDRGPLRKAWEDV